MSGESEAEMSGEKTHEQEVNAPQGSTPEAEPNSAVANFRQGFFTESRYELLLALGEEPPEHQQSAHLQSMEDSYLRRMWRLINALEKVRQGVLQKKEIKKDAIKAAMYMKTNKTLTKCPAKVGHLRLRFGHLRLTDTNFSGKSGFVMAISCGLFRSCAPEYDRSCR